MFLTWHWDFVWKSFQLYYCNIFQLAYKVVVSIWVLHTSLILVDNSYNPQLSLFLITTLPFSCPTPTRQYCLLLHTHLMYCTLLCPCFWLLPTCYIAQIFVLLHGHYWYLTQTRPAYLGVEHEDLHMKKIIS